MKNKPGRRVFLKTLGLGGAAAFLPKHALSIAESAEQSSPAEEAATGAAIPGKRKYNSAYTGRYLDRVAFPIGGLGAGMFCLEGSGAISQISTQNQPDVFNDPGMFAAIYVKGVTNGAKLLEGPVPAWKHFGLHNSALGFGGSAIGLPHFSEASI